MATRKGAKKTRRADGQGESVTIYFDKDNPVERKAQRMAKILAGMGRGKRKAALVATLAALYDAYEATGEVLTAADIADLFTGSTTPLPGVAYSQPPTPYSPVFPAAKHQVISPSRGVKSAVVVTDSPPKKTSAAATAANFLASAGCLFD